LIKIQIRGKQRSFVELWVYARLRIMQLITRISLKLKYGLVKTFCCGVYTNHKFLEGIKFFTPNFRGFERIHNAHLKEPMTQQWIKSFSPGETLWDIGANVGVFSFLAANSGTRVVAIEPLYGNHYSICKTLELNPGLTGNVMVMPVALTDLDGSDILYIPCNEIGYSGVQFGRTTDPMGNDLNEKFRINLLGLKASTMQNLLLDSFSSPDYIKIDVDGIELKILKGLHDILQSSKLKSLLIEAQDVHEEELIRSLLEPNGFSCNLADRESTIPSSSNCESYNLIFRRN